MLHQMSTAPTAYPSADALAALRAWYAGLDAKQAVARYLGRFDTSGHSSRTVLTVIRKQLQRYAAERGRQDLADTLNHTHADRTTRARAATRAMEEMRSLAMPAAPTLGDGVGRWLPPRAAQALRAAGLETLADVAPLARARRRWWTAIPRLGEASAKAIDAILAEHAPVSGDLAPAEAAFGLVPLERLVVPMELDGTEGTFRAPVAGCTLSARTDLEAVAAWLSRHETANTLKAYRKETERLVLWALLARGKALSSLTAEDAIAYRGFLRRPPARWVGPARPRTSPEWRPFSSPLAPRSTAYALSIVSALFRWLKEQNYVLANPFSGLKVKGGGRDKEFDVSHAMNRHEWELVRVEADLVDLRHGWPADAAWRLRFMLDFWVATGLRPSELVGAKLANIERVPGGDSWLHVLGKGDKRGRVALPPLAIASLERYLAQRGLPVSTHLWKPETPLLPSLAEDDVGLTTARVRAILKRFFLLAASQLATVNPALAAKLTQATPHWLRHSHATQLLAAGADLKTVRDNLRHANIATTSVYLDSDDVQRAKQLSKAFPA